jgi:hypothetical protein
MPNWVSNSLNIIGDKEQITRLVAQVSAPYTTKGSEWVDGKMITVDAVVTDQDFSFWNISRPEGEDLDKYNESMGGGTHATPFWYEWNSTHWNTKWEACDATSELTHGEKESWASYHFQTAWSPPTIVLAKLAEQYPTLKMTFFWEEEQGFGEDLEITGGEIVVNDSWDTPETHEDTMKRRDYCYCEDAEDQDDIPFDDCPTKVDPNMIIDKNEIEMEALI